MKCPYCEKEMRLGYIPNGEQPVQWIPEGQKPAFTKFSVAKYGIELKNQFAPFKANGYKAEAHYCSACGIVISEIKK